jgi:septal ring factor EnvC (AmiA/AmiB activator)
MVYQASKNQSYTDKVTFLFSAETFNQMIMRIKYLRQFSDARKYQVEQIEKVMATLAGEKVKLKVALEEKNQLFASKQSETESLNQSLESRDEMLQQLALKEKELKKEVAQTERENKKLEKLIADIVRREIEKARREAERKAREAEKSSKTANLRLTPEAAALSATFSANVKKLPWPVLHGEIISHFGKQPHPVLKGVTVENMGVDILTMPDEPVRAVFDGKVVTIASVPGMNHVVMIQHGDYYTVYARLKTVTVTNGQQVKAKDQIGFVSSDKDGQSQVQFQVWKNSVKLNPEEWLFRK